MKRYLYCILFSVIIYQLLGQVVNDELHERVYLQTDKQLYLSGESILMKLLTVDSELNPLCFSKIAYVELLDDSISQTQIKVELNEGIGSGSMGLPTDLPSGYYRLIAYTQFMRNEGTDVFFEKNIAVMNTFQSSYQLAEKEKPFPSDSAISFERGLLIQPDQKTYSTRTQGELILNGLPEKIHTLSVSIAGKDIVPVTESDLSLFQKNRIKKPVNEARATKGNDFILEYEGHIITGKIIDNTTNTVPTSVIPMVIYPCLSFPTVHGIRFFAGQKNGIDEVRFFTSGVSGTKEIATIVYRSDERYRVDILSPFESRHAPKHMPTLYIDSAYYGSLLKRSVALQVYRYFSGENSTNQYISEPNINIKPAFSYLLDEYTRFTTMQEVFTEFVQGVRFRRNAGRQEIHVFTYKNGYVEFGTMPLVLLDGIPVSDHNVIYNYDPLLVEQINIYNGPFKFGGHYFDGIVELLTYQRQYKDLYLDRSSQVISYEGPQLPHRLVSPDYSIDKNRQSRIPDCRHTLLWDPDIRTNGESSVRIAFDTSDITGEFQATVEGVTKDGIFIYATAFFMVQ